MKQRKICSFLNSEPDKRRFKGFRRSSRCDGPIQSEVAEPPGAAWKMIDLYYWTTPNGHKLTIFLEEAGLPYRIIPINIGKGDQFKPEFLRVSPNNKIPAIVDHEPADGGAPLPMFESGAILLY